MKKWFSFLVICWLALLLSGCGNFPGQQPETNQTAYEVTDSQGHVLKLAQKPQKIVPLSIGTDEIVVHLVPLERIAALTYLSDDPGISNVTEQAKLVKTKVRANPEQIIALQPDLVLIPDWQPPELAQILRDAQVPVYVYHAPDTVAKVKQSIMELAKVLREEAAGQRLIEQMDRELTAIQKQVDQITPERRKTVLRFSLLGVSGGKDSLFDDLCQYAAVINGAAATGLSKNEMLSKEQIVQINPDVLIMPMWDYTGKTDMNQYREEIYRDPSLQSVKAIRDNRLVMAPDKYQNSSSQYIVYGVRDIARAAYPELDWPAEVPGAGGNR